MENDPQVKVDQALRSLFVGVDDLSEMLGQPETSSYVISNRADIGLALSRLDSLKRRILLRINEREAA